MTPLLEMEPGQALTLQRIDGGHEFQRRLVALGLLPGVQLQLLRRDRRGPLVIDLHGARLALGRGVARKLLVARPVA